MIETNLEIGNRSEFKMTYDEAVMYCFSLNINGKIGWRLPTRDELINLGLLGWYQDDPWRDRSDVLFVTPVRDLKDD